MMKKLRIVILFIFFILIMKTQVSAFSITEELINDEQIITPEDDEILSVDSVKKVSGWDFLKAMVGNSLPSKYRLDDYIKLNFKDEMNTGECWSMSVCSMLETTISKITGKTSDEYSSRHMNYSTTSEYSNWNRQANSGGNSYIGLSYFVSGKGPVLEKDFPFKNNSDSLSSEEVSQLKNAEVQKKVDDFVYFTEIKKEISSSNIVYKINDKAVSSSKVASIRNDIKNHIKTYGGVTTYTCGNSSQYFNYSTNSTYCNSNELVPSHQVVIIGWDDNYSRDNFRSDCKPLNDGAYICMESYGTTSFDNGFIYISYDDVLVERAVMGITKVSNIGYDNLYLHDETGSSSAVKYDNNIGYAANVFKRESVSGEYLSEVGLYINSFSKVKVYVWCDKEIEDISNINEMVEVTSKESEILEPGYHTIKLDNKIRLCNDSFVVIVKYISADEDNEVKIPIEYPNSGYAYNYSGGEIGESFFSKDGVNWVVYKYDDNIYANACIKCFTIINENYDYVVNGDYIKGVSPNLNSNIFKYNVLQLLGHNSVINGVSNEIIKNGDVISITDSAGNTKEYTLIVKGDINSDGDCDIIDLMMLKQYLIDLCVLDSKQIMASDVSLDNSVNVVDLSEMMKYIVKASEW